VQKELVPGRCANVATVKPLSKLPTPSGLKFPSRLETFKAPIPPPPTFSLSEPLTLNDSEVPVNVKSSGMKVPSRFENVHKSSVSAAPTLSSFTINAPAAFKFSGVNVKSTSETSSEDSAVVGPQTTAAVRKRKVRTL